MPVWIRARVLAARGLERSPMRSPRSVQSMMDAVGVLEGLHGLDPAVLGAPCLGADDVLYVGGFVAVAPEDNVEAVPGLRGRQAT